MDRSLNLVAYLVLPLAAAVGVGGCALPADGMRMQDDPIYFPNRDTVPHVVRYGTLQSTLPRYDAASRIERFLYGPSARGRTYLRNPQGMASLRGRLLVCDQGLPDVVAIDLSSGKRRRWTDGDHQPRCPVDITVDDRDNVYVADTTLGAVLVYDADGKFLRELSPSPDPSRTFRPCGVLAHGEVLYVGDLGTQCVRRWELSSERWLEPLATPPGELSLIAPTGLSVTADGVLLIADAVQGRVFRVRNDGEWLAPIGRPGTQPGQFIRPKHVSCTSSGLIFVSDAGRQSVLAFDATGKYLLEIHERAEAWEGFTLPAGLLAVRPAEIPALAEQVIGRGFAEPDECIIVSDSLSDAALTVLGVFPTQPEEGDDGE